MSGDLLVPVSRNPARSGYTIGITTFVNRDGRLSLFENGLRQNVLFLYQMFCASPRCARVFLLNHGDGEPGDTLGEAGIPPEAIVRTAEVLDELDFVISIGAAMDRETVAALKARAIPVIGYKCGNGGVIAMEAMCAVPPRGDAELYFDSDYFDVLWMTPQHIHTYKAWCETVYRARVVEVPQVWSPHFIASRPPAVRENFAYVPGRQTWRVGVMDPNITVMKTSHVPMLVCEAAWRAQPEAFEALFITNALPHAAKPHFAAFYNALSAGRAGVMTLEPRFVSADMLADHCDAVVTHHWENGLNYLYYEVLHGGYPLVHNSAFLKDQGYYYPDFDALAGGEALLRAFRDHDRDLDAYRRRADALIAGLDPLAPANLRLHEDLLARAARVCA